MKKIKCKHQWNIVDKTFGMGFLLEKVCPKCGKYIVNKKFKKLWVLLQKIDKNN